MAIGETLLGLLESGPQYGYGLKKSYDAHFGRDRPLDYGQVYSTLSRLLRDGLVSESGVEAGGGPSRKRYAITSAGVTDVDRWLTTPEPPQPYLQNTLYTKVVLALLSGRSAQDVLDGQRAAHTAAMRGFTARKRAGDLADQLICDFALFHLEADLRWLELTASRIDELATATGREPAP
jgi:DNA-binding PadR family transcriptional regulator